MPTQTKAKTVPTTKPTRPATKRISKPATSPRALRQARERRDALLAVLQLRGDPVDRAALQRLADTAPTAEGRAKAAQELRRLTHGAYAKAANAYLLTHEKFAWQEAHKMAARHVPLEDLKQAAVLGMLRALDKFAVDRVESGAVTSFLSYARWWVKCEIGKLLDDEMLVRIPSTARKVATELRDKLAIAAELASTAPECMSDADVAKALSMSVEKVKSYRHLYLGHEHYDVTVPQIERTRRQRRGQDEYTSPLVADAFVEMEAASSDDSEHKSRLDAVERGLERLTVVQRALLWQRFGVGGAVEGVAVPDGAVADALVKAALGRLRAVATMG